MKTVFLSKSDARHEYKHKIRVFKNKRWMYLNNRVLTIAYPNSSVINLKGLEIPFN